MSEIGGIKLDGPFLSAPLAGVTDSVMRRLNRAMGAALVYSEMREAGRISDIRFRCGDYGRNGSKVELWGECHIGYKYGLSGS